MKTWIEMLDEYGVICDRCGEIGIAVESTGNIIHEMDFGDDDPGIKRGCGNAYEDPNVLYDFAGEPVKRRKRKKKLLEAILPDGTPYYYINDPRLPVWNTKKEPKGKKRLVYKGNPV